MNKGEGKNVGPSGRFLNKFSFFSFLSCYPNSGKDLISLPFLPLPLPLKPNKVLEREEEIRLKRHNNNNHWLLIGFKYENKKHFYVILRYFSYLKVVY